MTHTFNQVIYSNLLAQAAPKVIETEEEYESALALAEKLTFAKNKTPEERLLYRLLVTLIEAYEAENYPMNEVKPHEVLRHIVEASGISQADLANLIGSDNEVSEILSGKRAVNETQARAIGTRFKVSSSFFIEEAP